MGGTGLRFFLAKLLSLGNLVKPPGLINFFPFAAPATAVYGSETVSVLL